MLEVIPNLSSIGISFTADLLNFDHSTTLEPTLFCADSVPYASGATYAKEQHLSH